MGEGDIMIAGTIGAILGLYTGVFAIFLSSILTIPAILFSKEREMPFIPFLALALWIVYIFEERVILMLNTLLFS
jgi:leader peptidase (prepilin peptidase)/N-methyltransferase